MTQESHGDRLAIIGCGAAAEFIHLPALDRIGWKPVLLVDPNIDRARDLASNVGAIAAADYVDHVDAFDAAFVSVPHVLHAPLTCSLLAHGKPVLVEKPIALTQAEGERMVDVAERAGLPLAVGLMRRQLAAAQWLKAFLDSGGLGRIESFDVRDGFLYQWMLASDAIWRKEKAGGGVLMDVGAHVLDLLLWWLGPTDVVSYKDDSYGGVEADCIMELTLRNGARGVVELSRTRGLRQSAIIRGERGWIEIGVDSNVLRAEPSQLLGLRFHGTRGRSIKPETYADLFDAQAREWRRVLTVGGDLTAPGTEAVASVALIERCYAVRQRWELPWVRPVVSMGTMSEGVVDVEDVEDSLEGCKVVVTGATGFIGSRVVERLILEHRADVRTLVRRYSGAARIARFEIAMSGGALEDADAVDRAIAGADIVLNLAYVTSNEIDENIAAIDNVIDSCLRHNVRRLVQVSSFTVHEPFPDGDIDADTATTPENSKYARAKIAVERHVLNAVRERGLPAVILRPSIVYGPFGGYWTDRPVQNLLEGTVVLPDDGSGLCNGVFVDDLIDAMFLAATRTDGIGESFLISGPEPVTWRTFYEALEDCVGVKSLRFMPSPQPDARSGGAATSISQDMAPKRLLQRLLQVRTVAKFRGALGESVKRPLRRIYRRYLTPRQISAEFDYAAKSHCRIDKARTLLGYDPKYDFEAGMAITREYVRWAYPRSETG